LTIGGATIGRMNATNTGHDGSPARAAAASVPPAATPAVGPDRPRAATPAVGPDLPPGATPAAGPGRPPAATPVAGLHVPLVTPFAPDGDVDLGALRRLAARVLDDGADGLVALGTTGESTVLNAAEQDAVVDCCAEVCSERGAPLTVGVAGGDTATVAREVARLGGRDGVAAVLSVVPPYLRPARAGVVAHYRALAAASPVPLLAYDNPPRVGVHLGTEALLELHDAEPRIVGVKLSVPALDGDALALLAGAPESFAVLCGEDALILAMLAHGAAGAISAAANCATARFAALVRAGRAGALGDVAEDAFGAGRAPARPASALGDGGEAMPGPAAARRHHDALLPFVRALGAESGPSIVKGVLHRRGALPTPSLRLPNVAASEAAVDAAERALTAASGRLLPA
jgi:4-hydroxy-tetrahydrodipicolinate synthase